MATYTWRVTNGAFNLAADWTNNSTGDNPSLSYPVAGDTVNFVTSGGTITGPGSVRFLNVAAATSGTWTFAGAITSGSVNIANTTTFTSGASLTLTGIASATPGFSPFTGNINGPLTLVGATLDSSAGFLNVGSPFYTLATGGGVLSLTAGSTATALGLVVGYGSTGKLVVTGAGSKLTTAANSTYPTLGYLSVGQAATLNGVTTAGNGMLQVTDGGTVALGNGLAVGYDSGAIGAATVSGGGSIVLNGGSAQIGEGAGSNGTVTIDSGGTFKLAAGVALVGDQAGAVGTLTINAGGTLVSTQAAQTANYILNIGNRAGSGNTAAANGTVTVQGTGALIDLGPNPLSVGLSGTGTLNVLAGATVKTETTSSSVISGLAIARGGTGTVNVGGAGSLLQVTGGLYAGRASGSVAVINVTAGGTLKQINSVAGDGVTIGSYGLIGTVAAFGGTGTLNVATSGTVTIAGTLAVGSNGSTGTLALATGGTLTASGLISIGTGTTQTGGTGTVTITGGAALHSAGPHVAGSASIAIASQASTTGTVTVSGVGSLLDGGGDRISVGSRGTGTLKILAGATATAGNTLYATPATEAGFSLGSIGASSGTATIDGTGSMLTVTGDITIGGSEVAAGGTGRLVASNAGGIAATGLILYGGGTLVADARSLVKIGAGTTTATGVGIMASASLTAHGGTIDAVVTNAGTLSNDGSLTVTGGVTGAGTINLLSGSTTDIAGSVAGQTITFADATPLLRLHKLSGAAHVTMATAGDVIDLVGITDVTISGNTVSDGDGSIDFTNLAIGSNLMLSSDGHGGTNVSVACYCPGTLILTPRGEVAVERLAIGDLLVTADGPSHPIVWIGRRSYAGRFLARQHRLLPIHLRAGSLGAGLPRRDLRVSPDHALFIDGVLVPARELVNGVTIFQERACDRVDYIHVELARHDIILAEGAAAETFLDEDSRSTFQNADEYARLYPAGGGSAGACAPRVESGLALDAIRRRLVILAGADRLAA